MAHVTEFVVEGLAGRTVPAHEKLDRHLNIFFGQNGSGKTSLLKILHSAMSGEAEILLNVPFTRAEVKIYSVDYDRIFTRTCKNELISAVPIIDEPRDLAATISAARTLSIGEQKEPKLKWDQNPPLPQKVPQSWSHRYLPTARLYLSAIPFRATTGYAITSLALSEDLLEKSFADLVNKIWSSYSAKVLGAIQRAQAEGLADILKAILSGTQGPTQSEQLDPPTAYERVASFLQRQGAKAILGDLNTFRSNYLGNAQLRTVVGDINKVELKIQDAITPRDKLQSVIQQMFTGNKKVVFADTGIEVTGTGDVKIGLARLSSGEKQLIRILIDTLLAGVNSVILDEPEISMHVDWQRNLTSTMRQLSPNAQLIIATHSPEIMAEIEDKNIFRL